MLGSRAALNGNMLHTHALNGGGFVVPTGAMQCAIQLYSSTTGVRRATAQTRTSAGIVATTRTSKRATAVAVCTAQIGAHLAPTRRVVPRASRALIYFAATIHGQRRAAGRLRTVIRFHTSASLFWKHRVPSPAERQMRILSSKRHLLIPPDRRGMIVQPERTMSAAAERREMQ